MFGPTGVTMWVGVATLLLSIMWIPRTLSGRNSCRIWSTENWETKTKQIEYTLRKLPLWGDKSEEDNFDFEWPTQ